jgi:hypothetical protein
MDPAFRLRETAPAAGPPVFAGSDAIGAGHAPDRKVAIGIDFFRFSFTGWSGSTARFTAADTQPCTRRPQDHGPTDRPI